VLFADPGVGQLYRHDSPYTYFTSDELHLGAISLECSRAGASAAALWLTVRSLPLRADTGFGPIVAAGRRAALDWAGRLAAGGEPPGGSPGPLRLHQWPELDIVTYFPWRPDATAAGISAASRHLLAAGMAAAEDPVWLSTLRVDPDEFARRHPDVARPVAPVEVLRSVLMKPEHEPSLGSLLARVSELAESSW